MTKLYLAHPREIQKEIREWQMEFENRTGIKMLNPFQDIDKVGHDEDINEPNPLEAYKALDPISLVESELRAIEQSKGLIGIVDGSLSYGTIMEIKHAGDIKIPIYLLVTNGHQEHPWFQYFATEIFTERSKMERGLIENYGK